MKRLIFSAIAAAVLHAGLFSLYGGALIREPKTTAQPVVIEIESVSLRKPETDEPRIPSRKPEPRPAPPAKEKTPVREKTVKSAPPPVRKKETPREDRSRSKKAPPLEERVPLPPPPIAAPKSRASTDASGGPPAPSPDSPVSVSKKAVSPAPSPPSIQMAVPRYGENPPPAYPALARKRGYEGVVVLAVHVDAMGTVREAKIETGSGLDVLDRAALAAVRNWRFVPGKNGEAPAAMWVRVPVEFRLE